MAALTQDRNTPRAQGDVWQGGVAASVKIYAGAIVMRNATGFLTKGQTAASLVGVGRAEEQVTGGTNPGDVSLNYRPGVFRFANSTSDDLITIADIGKPCYAVDDQTVSKTHATNTRSIAGFVVAVEARGVWVEFDEARVRSHLAGIA